MGELAQTMKRLRNLPTVIQEHKGRFYFVGSIPITCTHPVQSGFSRVQSSNVYESLEDAKQALREAGIVKCQLPDCSWCEL